MSLKELDTQEEPQRVEETSSVFHKPKRKKNKRKLITAAILVLISGVLLFGAIKIIDATQTDTTSCPEWTRKDCIKEEQQPPCPEQKLPCPLNTAEQGEQPSKKEKTHE